MEGCVVMAYSSPYLRCRCGRCGGMLRVRCCGVHSVVAFFAFAACAFRWYAASLVLVALYSVVSAACSSLFAVRLSSL